MRRHAVPGPLGLILALTLAAGCSDVVRDKPVVVPEQVTRVVVSVDHGNVEVVATREQMKVEVVRSTRAVSVRGEVSPSVRDGVLTIEGKCGSVPKCRINYRLRVPLTTAVSITASEGDVALIDVAGDVEVELGLGNISGLRLTGAHVDAATEGGNIDLIFAAPPERLHATAAAGDVDLRVPAGKYRCELDPKAVPPFGVKCDAGGTRLISAGTGVGRVNVHATD